MSAKVSVVMPVYNGARYLRPALASLRWQTFTDWEAVCVNDGSTDESLAILREYAAADSRFRILDQQNEGIVAALNRGVLAARAPWIARVDADDVAVPERLATQWQHVLAHPDTVVVGSYMLSIDSDGFPICTLRYPTEHDQIERAVSRDRVGVFGHPSVLMRKDAAIQAGLYRPQFEWVEDIDLWMRMIRWGRVANIPQVLVHYRQHEQSVCWSRHALQHERFHLLLAQAHAERGLCTARHLSAARNPPKKRTATTRKWARRAVRSGHYHTAWRQWKRQVLAQPFSLSTCYMTLEVLVHAITTVLRRREPPLPPLPDWRPWDATSEPLRRVA